MVAMNPIMPKIELHGVCACVCVGPQTEVMPHEIPDALPHACLIVKRLSYLSHFLLCTTCISAEVRMEGPGPGAAVNGL